MAIDPWEGNPYDTGRPQNQGLPSIEDLMQQGNVQVQPGGAATDQRDSVNQLLEYTGRQPQMPQTSLGGKYTSLRDLFEMGANAPEGTNLEQFAMLQGQTAPIEKQVGLEEETTRGREAEAQQIRMKGEEQRKGIQMQEELKMQGQREQTAAEQAGMLERLRKTPLSGILGMTLEQFDALPPEQKEQYRKAVMMQSGGFGKVMENLMSIIQQMPEGPSKLNMTHYAMALAESLFTRQEIEQLINRTVGPTGDLRIRHKRLDVTGAAPSIRPGGQPYGPEEEPVGLGPGLMRSGRRAMGTTTNAPPPGMGEPGVDMGMFTEPTAGPWRSRPQSEVPGGNFISPQSAIRG